MIVIELIYNLSVLVALSVFSGFIGSRFKRTGLPGKIYQGLLFGFTAIVGMLYPFMLTEGIIFDGRSIVISLCTLFFGPVSGIISAFVAAMFRLYLGGGGMVMGILVISSSFLIGYLFYLQKEKNPDKILTNLRLYVFGLLVHAAMLLFVMMLPSEKILEAYQTLSITIIGAYPLVTVLIGKILSDQEINQNYLQQIEDSEEKYRLLVENQSDLIVKTDLEGRFLFVNLAYCQLFDKSENELIGKTYTPLVHIEDLPHVKKAIADLFKPPFTCSYQERAKTRYGWRWLEWEAKAVRKDGQVTALIGTGRDITERKKAESKLKESEEKYRMLVENTHALLFSTDTRGKFTYLNEAAANTLGSAVDKILGRFYLQFVHPDDRNHVHDSFTKQLTHASPDHFIEFRYINKNGDIGWLRFLVNPIIINSELVGLNGVALNITQTKLAEEELTKLKRAIEQSSISVIITDNKGSIEYVNPYFTELTGFTSDEVKGKNPRLLKSGLHSESFYKQLWGDITSGKDWQGEMYNRKRNGECYWQQTVISPLVNRQGAITHFVAIQEDVSEKKKLIEDLIAAKENAEEMNKIKSLFFANMSHELRTPMIGILGNAELLEMEIDNDEHLKMIQTIRRSALRLHETLNSILDISKIEVEGVQKSTRPVEINNVVGECINLFNAVAAEKGLEINFIKNNESIKINSDDNLLTKVLNNLLNNAVKYTDHGKIIIRTQLINNKARIEIEDTGIGIDPEYLNIIFEPFRQTSEGYSRRYEGTGLGLTITKKFVEVLGGTISVVSTKDKGSIFIVDIPDNLANINNEDQMPIIKEKEVHFDNDKTKKILLVEDETINAEVILRLLNDSFITDWVRYGHEAIIKAQERKYDVILMDIGLQGDIDGLQTAKEILKLTDYEKIPIIAVTAYAMEGDREKFLSNGCTHYISKPFNKKELLKIIGQALNENSDSGVY
jgi:PAS domain S-box-containing protein